MAGWKLKALNTNLAANTAIVRYSKGSGVHPAIAIEAIPYDGSGDLTESQLKKRVLEASKTALQETIAAIQADLDALEN